MKRLLILLMMSALLGGCATFEVIEKSETAGPDKSYSVDLPLNWVRQTSVTDRIIVTRDGFGLQRIMVSRTVSKDAFPKLKKGADEKLLASELAELQIAEMKSSGEQLSNLTVLENVPVSVGGKNGFKLRLQFKSQRGLDFGQIYYGVVHKGYYYLISYHSPRLYYFEKYLPDFDRTVASFRLT